MWQFIVTGGLAAIVNFGLYVLLLWPSPVETAALRSVGRRFVKPDAVDLLKTEIHDAAEAEAIRLELKTLYGELEKLAVELGEGLLAARQVKINSDVINEKITKLVAHLSEAVPRYWFVDSPALQQFLTTRLRTVCKSLWRLLRWRRSTARSGILVQAYATSVLTVLRKSLTTLRFRVTSQAFLLLPATGSLSSSRWRRRTLSNTCRRRMTVLGRRLFGVPVVVSNAQASGVSHAVGNGAIGLDTDTAGVQVAWSETSNATDWASNMIRCRVEGASLASVLSCGCRERRSDAVTSCRRGVGHDPA